MRSLCLWIAAVLAAQAQPTENLNFYRTLNDGKQVDEMMPRYLRGLAARHFEERAVRVRQTRDWTGYRRRFREKLLSALGGLPERTPLNPSVTGVIERDGYRIEKVIFESQPKFFVTANLYVPTTGTGPYPAVLFPLGHEAGAKAHSAWQMVLANLAKRGFVMLAWDPIGQGERVQLWDDDFQASKVIQSTTEHTMEGIQTLMVGDALARYTIWDAMRALDYLASRPEVDAKRIGITGNSGGGTHSSYVASLDDRISVAAPSCYLTNWRRLLETIGPQDAEQCFPGWIAAGYDHPDFIYGFGPKPFLMLTAVRDFFSIGGARETYAEAARVYDSLGIAEKFAKVEADDGHGYTKPRREAAYRWFTRWLKGAEDTTPEYDVALLSERELSCTPTGQVATSLRGETVHSLNLARWKQLRAPGRLDDVRRLSGFTAKLSKPPVQEYGTVMLPGGARMTKLVYQTEPGILVPALLYAGEGAQQSAIVLAHGRGKAAAHEMALSRVKAGEAVLSIDLRGMGETSPGGGRSSDWQRFFGDYNSAMTAILLNRPLVGMRAEDISAAVTLLSARLGVDPARISVYGVDGGAVPALYATALDSRIASATLEGMLQSYEIAVRRRIHRGVFEQVVPGALRFYDLPDLITWSKPRPVKVLSKVDSLGQ
ncbi:MAG TPA: acetylxylan esterase [Bryobacteraceae bacterium]|nr:acetylxylan esterase [Bryobacteraceae bacterium]